MVRVVAWTTEDWQRNMARRLEASMIYRSQFDKQWMSNKIVINTAMGRPTDQFNISFDNIMELESGEVDGGDSEIGTNYCFKYLRFFHSQLSANPPSVIVRPSTTDPGDREKADAGDKIVRYAKAEEDADEVFDEMTWRALVTGTGWLKGVWDKNSGEVHDFNEETSELIMRGDICTYSPHTEDVWTDPEAKRKKDVRFIFERHTKPLEEALLMFPGKEEILQKSIETLNKDENFFDGKPKVSVDDSVEFFEYYEKALPVNGMVGRHVFCLRSGELLSSPGKNPHVLHQLPYHVFTYIDNDGHVYGKSVIEYVARLQDMLNRLDSNILDNVEAHGVVRMAVHESADIEDEAVSNSAWDWVKYSGDRAPSFIQSPTLMPDIWRLRMQLVTSIQELFGINDSMLGIQRRETSAVSQQTAIEAGTMIHRRLFKKYAAATQSFYRDYLGMVKEHWDLPRIVTVLGQERAFQAPAFKGADVAGNIDLFVEYGASLPLDPNMKREALLLLKPLLQEAGMSAKQILFHMKLNDLEGANDRMEQARTRQKEVFDEMIAKFKQGMPEYIAPEELEEHTGRLEYAYDYLETSEFKYLPPDLKAMLRKHVKEREEFAAKRAAPVPEQSEIPGMPGVSGAAVPEMGGLPPELAGMM